MFSIFWKVILVVLLALVGVLVVAKFAIFMSGEVHNKYSSHLNQAVERNNR